MTEENEFEEQVEKPADAGIKKTSVTRTLLSLALFIGIYYLIFRSWTAVLLLVMVILIHESGHFAAMKFFGYKAVNMTFVPFVGAYVSGEATSLSRQNKLIVLLAGPLPGILIGCVIFYLHQQTGEHIYFQAAMPFLLLNLFNLLPVFPLDGGQVLQTLYFNVSRILQLTFLWISVVVLIYLFIKLGYDWWILAIAVLVLFRIRQVYFTNKIRKQLDIAGIDYACTYEELTDDEYWQIRNIIISNSKSMSKKYSTTEQFGDEQDIIKLVENMLVPPYEDDITIAKATVFSLLWLIAFLLPVFQWLFYKGYF